MGKDDTGDISLKPWQHLISKDTRELGTLRNKCAPRTI